MTRFLLSFLLSSGGDSLSAEGSFQPLGIFDTKRLTRGLAAAATADVVCPLGEGSLAFPLVFPVGMVTSATFVVKGVHHIQSPSILVFSNEESKHSDKQQPTEAKGRRGPKRLASD